MNKDQTKSSTKWCQCEFDRYFNKCHAIEIEFNIDSLLNNTNNLISGIVMEILYPRYDSYLKLNKKSTKMY